MAAPKTQNCGRVFYFNTDFGSQKNWKFEWTLEADNYGLKPLNLENYNIFGMLWTSGHGTTLYRSYLFQKLSILCFSFSSFCVFLPFSAQSSRRPIVKTLYWKFGPLHWFFCMIPHCLSQICIKKVHFTCLNTILPLSLSSPCQTHLPISCHRKSPNSKLKYSDFNYFLNWKIYSRGSFNLMRVEIQMWL